MLWTRGDSLLATHLTRRRFVSRACSFRIYNGGPPLISTISFFADLRERDRRPELVDLLSNLRQLLHCRPWVRSFKKDDLPVSFSPSFPCFYSYLYLISEDVRVGT